VNIERTPIFSVPEMDVALPWRTPVRVPDTLDDPPFVHAVAGGLNASLNWMEHDEPDALHCSVKDGPIRSKPLIRWV
jgi:hypothetical protein